MTDFIRRDEFSAEVRHLREDIKDVGQDIKQGISNVLGELKETSEEVNLLKLKHGIQEKVIDALEDMPQLESLRGAVAEGFRGVNARLDRVNGRLDSNTSSIGEHEGKIDMLMNAGSIVTGPDGMSKKTKVAVAGVGGIGILAVLHSLFEMIRTILPEIAKLFGKQ